MVGMDGNTAGILGQAREARMQDALDIGQAHEVRMHEVSGLELAAKATAADTAATAATAGSYDTGSLYHTGGGNGAAARARPSSRMQFALVSGGKPNEPSQALEPKEQRPDLWRSPNQPIPLARIEPSATAQSPNAEAWQEKAVTVGHDSLLNAEPGLRQSDVESSPVLLGHPHT